MRGREDRGGRGGNKPLRTGLRVLEIALFLGAVVMINVSSASGLFRRFDLTEGGLYALSPPSIDAVSALREPLTIRGLLYAQSARPLQHGGAGGARPARRVRGARR